MDSLIKRYDQFKEHIAQSELVSTIEKTFKDAGDPKIDYVRCLALGSPSQSKPALYQFALLEVLAEYFNCSRISLYDPVFNTLDEQFISSRSNKITSFVVESTSTDNVTAALNTLLFLPHAELGLTEEMYSYHEPQWMLSNDLITHTNSMTKRKLLESYPILAHLTNKLDDLLSNKVEDDGFQISKKKNRRKGVYVEPKLEYHYDRLYFTSVKSTSVNQKGPWDNAFSDLSVIQITPRNPKEEVKLGISTENQSSNNNKNNDNEGNGITK